MRTLAFDGPETVTAAVMGGSELASVIVPLTPDKSIVLPGLALAAVIASRSEHVELQSHRSSPPLLSQRA